MLQCEKGQKNTLKYASFSRIFIFRVSHFFCRKKIYHRYCQSMVSNNCLNYSSLVWNTKSCNIILSLDFISLRVYPTPKFMNSRYETQICIWKSRLYWNKHNAELQRTAPDTQYKEAFSTRGRLFFFLFFVVTTGLDLVPDISIKDNLCFRVLSVIFSF